jgi:hypothetical protein
MKPIKVLFIYSRLVFVTEWTSQSMCFHFNGCLVEWLPQDKPFEKHGYWFPDCAYVKYMKGPSFYHECLKYHKERHLTTDLVETLTTTDTPDCCLLK